MIQFYNFQTF